MSTDQDSREQPFRVTAEDIARYNADPFYAAPVTVREWLDQGHAVSELPHWDMVRDEVLYWIIGDGERALQNETLMLDQFERHGVACVPPHVDGFYPEGFDIEGERAGSLRRMIWQAKHAVELLSDEALMIRALATLSDAEHTSLAASAVEWQRGPDDDN